MIKSTLKAISITILGLSIISPVQAQELEIKREFPEFRTKQIKVGDKVNWSSNPHESGVSAFTNQTLSNKEQLKEWLLSDDDLATIKRNHLIDNGFDLDKGFNNFVPVQFTTDIYIQGNHYNFLSLTMRNLGIRKAQAGDIFWIYYDGKINKDLSIRADCGNAGFMSITPSNGNHDVLSVSAPYLPLNDEIVAMNRSGIMQYIGSQPSSKQVNEPSFIVGLLLLFIVCYSLRN